MQQHIQVFHWTAHIKAATSLPSEVSWKIKKGQGHWMTFPGWDYCLEFLLYFDTVGWVRRRACGLKRTRTSHTQRFSFGTSGGR